MAAIPSSDILKSFNIPNIEKEVTLSSNHCHNYIKRETVQENEIVFTINLTVKVLRSWYDNKDGDVLKPFSYVQILNVLISQYRIKIKEDCSRIQERLRRVCSEAKSKSCKSQGRKRCQLLLSVKSIAVRYEELANIDEELEYAKENSDALSKENEELRSRCESLYHELQDTLWAKQVSEQELEDIQNEYEETLTQNKHLKDYIDKTGLAMDLCNTGKRVVEVQKRQQRRKIKELKTAVERALWFAETYGLKLTSASFCDENGKDYDMNFSDSPRKKAFKDLSEDEQAKLKQILFIQDKFCVGEAAYHELTMTEAGEGLPRSYLIRQCKESLNDMCHIERTPGKAEGAQVNFVEELTKVLRNHINKLKEANADLSNMGKIKVKLSGDGAKMTRLTGFVIISFSILDDEESAMSSKGNHTVAVIKGAESYELLQTSCSNAFRDVKKLIREKVINIDGQNIEVEICMGGDCKFLLLIMGMKGATSDFACIWCKIHKLLRHDMSKPMDFYLEEDMKRTLQDIKECALKQSFSCEHHPLLNIPLENIVLDELHLMLRVTDKLTKNLVEEATGRDFKENIVKPPSMKTTTHLDNLTNAIRTCGISFSVWEKTNADGKASGLYDFTSLMGSDKKILLKKLPSKLHQIISPDTSDTVVQLWKDFDDIYSNLLQKQDPTDEDINIYFTKVKSWVNLFTSLNGKLKGYGKANITPYMHAMVYHVPHFMKIHKGIKKFTGQGVEKLNDDCRRIHLLKSNKWDAAKDVLLVGKRLELLSESSRTPRTYNKRAHSYWSDEIAQSRAKRHRLCNEEVTPPNLIPSDLTPELITSRLREMGITTRIRNFTRLQEMYRNAMMQADDD